MSDIALILADDGLSADLAIANGDLVMDDGLDTAVLISLLTDRLADSDDLTDPADPFAYSGGWEGDVVGLPGDRIGSKLYLLNRATLPVDKRFGGAPTSLMVQQFAAQALAWMIEDGVASSVTPNASLLPAGITGVAEALQLINAIAQGTKTLGKWQFAWAAQRAKANVAVGS